MVVPAAQTITFRTASSRPRARAATTGATLTGRDLFDEHQRASSVSWKPRPSTGNRMRLATFQGRDAVAKCLGGLQPSQLNILFRTEVEALRRLRNCENVVCMLAADVSAVFSETGARAPVVLTMHAALGPRVLDHALGRRAARLFVIARTFFDKLLGALEYAHLLRIAHTDVCLENCLIDHSGNLRLTGWGAQQVWFHGVTPREKPRLES